LDNASWLDAHFLAAASGGRKPTGIAEAGLPAAKQPAG